MIVDISRPQGLQTIITKIRSLQPSEVKLPSRDNLRPVHEGFLLLALLAWILAAFLLGSSWSHPLIRRYTDKEITMQFREPTFYRHSVLGQHF